MARRPEHEVRRVHWELVGVGVMAIVMGLLLVALLPPEVAPGLLPLDPTSPVQAATTMCFVVGLLFIGAALLHRRWYFAEGARFRREIGAPEGWLDQHDYNTEAGAQAVRAENEKFEPHTRTAVGKTPLPMMRHGFCAGRLVSGPLMLRGHEVYSQWSRGVCVLGPQGSGKSQLLVNLALDAPGAAVVNSTKPEIARMCQELRGVLGPTAVFNPLDTGRVENTTYWDPVDGCADEATAQRRAKAMVRGAGGADGVERADFWARKAGEVLRCYLMAAALGRLDMTAVMHWANNPDSDPTPLSILEEHPDTPAGWASQLRAALDTVKETRDGYFATVTSAVAFMDSPTVRAACRPTPGHGFDIRSWIRDRGTLFMIGSDDDSRLAPLFTAFTEEFFFVAKRIAADEDGGQLRTPMTFLLDEVAHMTPVPLHKWTGDSRGWGITVVAVVQSLSQFATTWGAHNAKTIWRNLPVRLVLRGVNDRETLDELSYLSGVRPVREVTVGTNHHGSGGYGSSRSERLTTEPVISGPTIGAMPRWHIFVLGLARHPAILRYEPGYQRVARENAELERYRASTNQPA